jgi:hypothetical protein
MVDIAFGAPTAHPLALNQRFRLASLPHIPTPYSTELPHKIVFGIFPHMLRGLTQ